MLTEPVSVGQAASLGSALFKRLRRKVRLRVESKAQAATYVDRATGKHTHDIEIDVRIFNIGQAVTITRVALVEAPSFFARLRNHFVVVAAADETGWDYYGHGSRSWRNLPAHIASGNFHMFDFIAKDIGMAERLLSLRLAIWHAHSRRPMLTKVEPPLRRRFLRESAYGGWEETEEPVK